MSENSIKDKVFCVAGIVTHYGSHDEAYAAIEAAGGKISKSIGAKTDVLVLGTNTSSQTQKAKSRGIPIISERQLVKLLAGEDVSIERKAAAVGDAPLEKLIGEARAALDGHPTPSMWVKVLRLVDSCAPDQLEALIDFLEPQVTRWEMPYDARWEVDRHSYGCSNAPGRWSQFVPFGEFRLAPHQWTVEMAAGEDSPKFRLVHAIHTRDMELNGTMLGKILSCKTLTNLRFFDPDENKISKTFFKKVRTAPSTRTLERFLVGRLDSKIVDAIMGEHHLDSLRVLQLHMIFAMKRDALHRLFEAPAWEHVETLDMKSYDFVQALDGITNPDVLPNLKTLSFFGSIEHFYDTLSHPNIERAETIRLSFDHWDHVLVGLEKVVPQDAHIKHLDFSLPTRWMASHASSEPKALAFGEMLASWNPPSSLEKLSLGNWYTEEIARELGDRTRVEVVR